MDIGDNYVNINIIFLGPELNQVEKIPLFTKIDESPNQQIAERTLMFSQNTDKSNSEVLLQRAIQSLESSSDMDLDSSFLSEHIDLLGTQKFSTVNLRDLD